MSGLHDRVAAARCIKDNTDRCQYLDLRGGPSRVMHPECVLAVVAAWLRSDEADTIAIYSARRPSATSARKALAAALEDDR